jgi:hypothetical protein
MGATPSVLSRWGVDISALEVLQAQPTIAPAVATERGLEQRSAMMETRFQMMGAVYSALLRLVGLVREEQLLPEMYVHPCVGTAFALDPKSAMIRMQYQVQTSRLNIH